MKTTAIINDLTNLLGANVSIFGQPTTLESNVSELVVDARKIFDNLRDYEVDYIVSRLDHERIENLEECILQVEDAISSTQDAIDSLMNATSLFPYNRGLSRVLDALENEMSSLEIELDDLRDELTDAEEDYIETEVEDSDDYLQELEEMFGMKELTCGNTYNWCGNISNHLNYTLYSCGDGYVYAEVRAHRYGDVRCNYTDTAIYRFDDECEFWECVSDASHYEFIEVDGQEYELHVSATSDTYEVYSDGCYVCTVYGDDLEELAEKIQLEVA